MTAIQVFLGDRLIGALEKPPFDMQRIPAEFPIIMVDGATRGAQYNLDLCEPEDMLWISTSRRHCRIAEREMEDVRRLVGEKGFGTDPSFAPAAFFAQHFGIPSYAERVRRVEDMHVEFRWYVAAPTLSQYEKMFDLPDFKPL